MNASFPTVGRLAFTVMESREPVILRGVAAPGVAVAIWRRERPAPFAEWLDALPPERLPSVRAATTADDAARLVEKACDAAGTPPGPERAALVSDVAALARVLAEVAGQPFIELRLTASDRVACPKFHVDQVRCRLLCACRGPGALYGAARPGGGGPVELHQLGTGDAALMRGALWPGREFPGILHRSPETRGETRLVLAVDPLDEAAGRC